MAVLSNWQSCLVVRLLSHGRSPELYGSSGADRDFSCFSHGIAKPYTLERAREVRFCWQDASVHALHSGVGQSGVGLRWAAFAASPDLLPILVKQLYVVKSEEIVERFQDVLWKPQKELRRFLGDHAQAFDLKLQTREFLRHGKLLAWWFVAAGELL